MKKPRNYAATDLTRINLRALHKQLTRLTEQVRLVTQAVNRLAKKGPK